MILTINQKQRKLNQLRKALKSKNYSIGSWIQLSSPDTTEIMAVSNYDWLTIDMEHGSMDISDLPNLIRSIELSGTIPLVRIPEVNRENCKRALDAGAYGLVLPMIESADDLKNAIEYSSWPKKGVRGVGYSRANMYGKYFKLFKNFAQNPFIVAQIESINALNELDNILKIDGLDVIMIGPYDFAASFQNNINLNSEDFRNKINQVIQRSRKFQVPCGIHVVDPNEKKLKKFIKEGYQFIAYSTDANFLINSSVNPLGKKVK